jgi:hypothetical protein
MGKDARLFFLQRFFGADRRGLSQVRKGQRSQNTALTNTEENLVIVLLYEFKLIRGSPASSCTRTSWNFHYHSWFRIAALWLSRSLQVTLLDVRNISCEMALRRRDLCHL